MQKYIDSNACHSSEKCTNCSDFKKVTCICRTIVVILHPNCSDSMTPQNNENNILTDHSIFKWHSFLPGETSVDDLSVFKFQGSVAKLFGNIIPEQYFTPCYCIHIITDGTLNACINNQNYEFHAHDGYLVTPDFLMVRPTRSDSYVEMYILTLSRKFIKELNPQFSQSLIAKMFIQPVWQMSERKTRRAVQYWELLREVVNDNKRTAAMHLVRSLFHYLAGDSDWGVQNTNSISRNEEITGRFMMLVDANCEQRHSLDWYASEMCLTTRYVANTVKQTLGITASSCIERALVQRAKTLLLTTTMPIQEIAEQLGFQNQSHFGTFFKRHEGVSPTAYRKHP